MHGRLIAFLHVGLTSFFHPAVLVIPTSAIGGTHAKLWQSSSFIRTRYSSPCFTKATSVQSVWLPACVTRPGWDRRVRNKLVRLNHRFQWTGDGLAISHSLLLLSAESDPPDPSYDLVESFFERKPWVISDPSGPLPSIARVMRCLKLRHPVAFSQTRRAGCTHAGSKLNFRAGKAPQSVTSGSELRACEC